MDVSVIVSTYTKERLKDVERCIESLENQSRKPDEIILVLDPDEDLVKFYKENIKNYDVIIEVADDFGLSNARNKGIDTSSGDLMAFIDDDAWADKDWLKNLLENFKFEDVWVAGGKVVPAFDKKRPRWLPEEIDWIVGCTYKGLPERKAEVRNPIGANMIFRREAFEVAGKFKAEIGRYGKKLLGSEEAELCLRLKKLKPNVKIIYDPSAVVYHRVPDSRTKIGYALRRAYYEGFSKAILSKEYKLETERSYLKFLLKSVVRKKPLEILGILLVVFCVACGNLYGSLVR